MTRSPELEAMLVAWIVNGYVGERGIRGVFEHSQVATHASISPVVRRDVHGAPHDTR